MNQDELAARHVAEFGKPHTQFVRPPLVKFEGGRSGGRPPTEAHDIILSAMREIKKTAGEVGDYELAHLAITRLGLPWPNHDLQEYVVRSWRFIHR